MTLANAATSPAKTLRTVQELAEVGLIPSERRAALTEVAARYALAITPASAALIDPSDLADPIARQFVPHEAELDLGPDELADPISDLAHSPVEGIVHRYPDRVLLMATHTCATYCRFCFRRESVGPGAGGTLSRQALGPRAGLHRRAPSHLGGDPHRRRPPGALGPAASARVMDRLRAIEHVKVVRLHTRVPAVDPERVTGRTDRRAEAGEEGGLCRSSRQPSEGADHRG